MSEEITFENDLSEKERKGCSITSSVISNYLLARQLKLTTQEKKTLENESIKILCDCVPATISDPSIFNNTVLVFGYVQSGKTLSFEMVTALARDNDYKLVIIIAGRTNILLNQTTKRFKDDLEIKASNGNFKIFQNLETNEDQLITNSLINPQKPTLIITVLKHQKYLNNLAGLFSKPRLKNNFTNKGVIIIDDESDQASLNTLALANTRSLEAEPNNFSAIYEGIKNLRQSFPYHTYIQYTATPQANLLIDYLDLLSPSDIHVLTPGNGYTGGATFFKESYSKSSSLLYQHTVNHWDSRIGNKLLYVREIPKGQIDCNGNYPEDEIFHPTFNDLSSPPNSMKEALRQFLIGAVVTIKVDKVEDYVSMLVHPTNIVKSHKKFKLWISSILEQWLADYIAINEGKVKTNDFYNKMRKSFEDYYETCGISLSFELIWESLFEIITGYKIHLVTGNELDLTNDVWEDHLCHILIGGTKLDRGFTVKNLICTYMPRYSKGRSNSDTIQQRCRFFGYKRSYLKSCRVYLPADSINEYADYVEDEEMLRTYFKKYSLKDFYIGNHSMHLTPRLNPTRHNILSAKIISNQYRGYKFFQPFGNFEYNNLIVKNFLSKLLPIGTIKYGETKHDVYLTNLSFAYLELIKKFSFVYPEDDIKVKNTALILESAEKTHKNKVYLLNMSQGEPRERGIKEYKFQDEENEVSSVYRIKTFHQGKNNNYPGDGNLLLINDKYKTEFGFDDDFIIQIHNFRPKEYFNIDFFSIAIYYPESLCANLISLIN